MKRLFYRPLDDLEDLRRLEAKVAKTRSRFRRFSRLALALAAFLLVMQLVAAGPEEEERPGLVVALVLAAATAILAVRALRTRPRALAAQRLLLQHRGLLFDEGRPAAVIGEEAGAILERLRARIAALPAPRRDLEAAHDGAQGAFAGALSALERSEADGQRSAREACARLCAALEAFRAALGRVEIDAVLAAGFDAGAAQTLARAAQILDGAPGPAASVGVLTGEGPTGPEST